MKNEHERRAAQIEESQNIVWELIKTSPRSHERDVLLLKLLVADIMPYSLRERMGTKRALRRAIKALESENR